MGPLLPCANSPAPIPNRVGTLPRIAATLVSALLVQSRWPRNVLEGTWSFGIFLVDQRTSDATNYVGRLVSVGSMPVGDLATHLLVIRTCLMRQIREVPAGRYVEPLGETVGILVKLLATPWLLAPI